MNNHHPNLTPPQPAGWGADHDRLSSLIAALSELDVPRPGSVTARYPGRWDTHASLRIHYGLFESIGAYEAWADQGFAESRRSHSFADSMGFVHAELSGEFGGVPVHIEMARVMLPGEVAAYLEKDHGPREAWTPDVMALYAAVMKSAVYYQRYPVR